MGASRIEPESPLGKKNRCTYIPTLPIVWLLFPRTTATVGDLEVPLVWKPLCVPLLSRSGSFCLNYSKYSRPPRLV